jgi:hypothetical protein
MSGEDAAISQPFYIRGALGLTEAIYLRRALSELGCGLFGGKACGRFVGSKPSVDIELDGISEGARRFSTATTISTLIVLA